MPAHKFIDRWRDSAAAERANYALFLSELCDYLEVPRPDPGQGALEGLRAFAPTLAEEDGGRGVAIGDGLDVHGSIILQPVTIYKHNYIQYMGTLWRSRFWLIFRKINGLPQNLGSFIRGTSAYLRVPIS